MLNNPYEYNREGFAGTAGPAPGGVVNQFADLNIELNSDGTQNDPERYFDKMQGLGLL